LIAVQVLAAIWLFIQNEVLGMKWLSTAVYNVLNAFGLDVNTRVGGMIHFFVYDLVKIFLLLSVLIFVISYVQSYFPPERTKKIVGRFHGIWANILAALLGTVTPFCSCSSIPLFIGFTNAGLPVGVTFSFLISSPLVDLGSLVLLMSIFGLRVAVMYVVVGVLLAVVGGTLIEAFGMDKDVYSFVKDTKAADIDPPSLTVTDRLIFARDQVRDIVHRVGRYVVIGVAIGAVIHNVIPATWISSILGRKNNGAVILATLVGVPIYGDIFGSIPVAESLFAKGAGLGTVLSFMMAVTALSLPSMVMLSKVVKPKLLVLFIAIVTGGIMVVGYIFNALQAVLI